jgi:tetratricopeptide (TPR) repeat protein
LGQAYTQKREYEKALNEYKKAIQLSPDNFAPHVHLAGVYALLGRQEEASNEAKKALELNPDFSMVRTAKTLPFKDEAYLTFFVEAVRKAGLK